MGKCELLSKYYSKNKNNVAKELAIKKKMASKAYVYYRSIWFKVNHITTLVKKKSCACIFGRYICHMHWNLQEILHISTLHNDWRTGSMTSLSFLLDFTIHNRPELEILYLDNLVLICRMVLFYDGRDRYLHRSSGRHYQCFLYID